ncbi:MAG: hypothetical protein SGJ27_17245 [Candidatus Melainabacteria bacterium]|nr:hypothetical protein [Candidatus Melainabacteria bacterium]
MKRLAVSALGLFSFLLAHPAVAASHDYFSGGTNVCESDILPKDIFSTGVVPGTVWLQAHSVSTANNTLLADNSDVQKITEWLTYGDGSSPFTIKYPAGWSVSTDQKTGKVDVTSGGGAKLSILPVFIANQKVEDLKPKQFFNTLIKLLEPGASWTPAQSIAINAYHSTYENDKQSATAALMFVQIPEGVAGRIVLAAVEKNSPKVSPETFAQIILSLKSNAPSSSSGSTETQPGSQSQSAMQSSSGQSNAGDQNSSEQSPASDTTFIPFKDPNEGAFTVEVPEGWRTEGGLGRAGAIDVRPWVRTVSPDGMITAFIGDGKIPPFTMPSAQGTSLGFGLGKIYNGTLVANYMPAKNYAEYYAKTNLKKHISDLQVVKTTDHPELALSINGTVGATKSEAASIKLTGMYGTVPAIAYYLAATKANVAYGTGMWWVTLIAGEISPADRDAAGLSVIQHMLKTFKMDPGWQARSDRNTATVSRNYQAAAALNQQAIMSRYRAQQAASDSITSSYWSRQASQDRAANNFSNYLRGGSSGSSSSSSSPNNFSNYIRGVENVEDPSTGTKYQVEYGPQYHYIDPTGSYYAGTNHGAPAPDWRQLLSVP